MSTEDTASKKDTDVSVCANCGKGEEESHKLKHCNACKMVKYCNRECQIAHRPQHKKECRKHVKELHDEELFKQPPLKEDCPICYLRLPTLKTGYTYQSCCGKIICSGCTYAPVYDNQGNEVDNHKCPYCRTLWPSSHKEGAERLKKRAEAGDPVAIYNTGIYYRDGTYGYPQNHTKALKLWHQAGELGYASANINIGYVYEHGDGVEVDMKKATHYYDLAAMRGNVSARYNLGNNEVRAGNIERALKHHMIAKSGEVDSLNEIKRLHTSGHATKEDYTKALQLYQEYLGEIKSDQRDETAAFSKKYRYY